MMESDSKVENQKVERRVDREIAIDAPLKSVWRAVSEARALKNWFPLEARVTPGVGGKIFLSWGPEYEGEAEIIAWDPGKRLTWREPTAVVDFTAGIAHAKSRGASGAVFHRRRRRVGK